MNLSIDKKLQGFQLIAQEKLQSILCSIPGKKQLILEHGLIKQLEHCCTASWLKLKGIQRIYIFNNERIITRTTDHVHIYMIRSNLKTFKTVLQHVETCNAAEAVANDTALKYFHVICVPSCYACFPLLLEEQGLYGLVQLHRFNWDFIYFDQGVLSLEYNDVFRDVFLHSDSSILPAIAQSIRLMQVICGKPELIITFGENAESIIKIADALGPCGKPKDASDYAAVLIIDRDKDFASSLLTPAIYAGLLLEVFKRRANEINVSAHNKIIEQKLALFLTPKQKAAFSTEAATATEAAAAASKKPANQKPAIKIPLNSLADEIYGDNRYKHFAAANSLIRAQAQALGLEVKKLNDMKLDEMHEYVARKLPKITKLKAKLQQHLSASEIVIEMLANNFRKVQTLEEEILNNTSRKRVLTEIDELLATDGQKYNTLRLMCLLHVCAGVTIEELQQFVRNYCNYFGHQYLHVFAELANVGLLPQLVECKPITTTTTTTSTATKSAKQILSNLSITKFQQTEFQANANRLKLLTSSNVLPECSNNAVDSNNVATNACPSFVFNGLYIPLIAQLCCILLKATNADDISNKLGMIDKLQIHLPRSNNPAVVSTPLSVKSFAGVVKQNEQLTDLFPLRERKLFIYLVGGVTYAEIGACDLISRVCGAQITVTSDAIISGSDLIASAF